MSASVSEDEQNLCTPPEICEQAEVASLDLLPTKSKALYETCYNKYQEWKGTSNIQSSSERVLLEYFNKLSKQYKPSSLWSHHSILKTTIKIYEKLDIKLYHTLLAFLKKQSHWFQSKKSKVLSAEDINTFLTAAPDEKYLLIKIDKVLKLYHDLAAIPTLVSATVTLTVQNGFKVQSIWTNKNLERHTKQKFMQGVYLNSDLQVIGNGFPVDINTELMAAYSQDEKLRAVVREVIRDGKTKQFIEIWDMHHLIKSYDLTELDEHGDVYTDSSFSALHWSPDNKRLLYVAEKKLPKCGPFYVQKSKSKSKSNEEPSRGTEYIFKADWGEQLVGKHQSAIMILNVEIDSIDPAEGVPEDLFPVQIIWAPNGVDIVGVAYKRDPIYLGLYACTNRESSIFHLKGTEFRVLTGNNLSCRTPRFSLDGKHLVWLERDLSGPHHHVHRLMHLNWGSSDKPDILVDAVKRQAVIANNKKFYGIYCQSLPEHCWSEDSKYFFFSTPQMHSIKSYVVNLETKVLTEIESPSDTSMIILDVKKNLVLVTTQSLLKPSQLHIARFDPSLSNIGSLNMMHCLFSNCIPNGDTLWFENIEYIYENDDPIREFNYTYLGKRDSPKHSMPLIVIPHGGPHSSFSNLFGPAYSLYALLGFGILYVNYRGSTGMGGDNIDFLLGKVGNADVLDCVTAIDAALARYNWIDPKKVNVLGGSHGGFLAAHLSGQHPYKFKSAVLCNPVIDIASMYASTDIPDWCEAESGCCFARVSRTGDTSYGDLLQKMIEHSPIRHVDKVKAPTMIAIGLKDLRVPSHQGKLWYNRLIANKVKTKLFVYDDNHSLKKDDVEVDTYINIALWLIEHNRHDI